MRNKICMSMSNPINYLSKEELSFFFLNVMRLNVVVELSSFCQFHDDKDVVGGVQHFIEFDNIGMVNKFQYFDLSFDLNTNSYTFEIMFLFFIFRLFIILTATFTPVKSCRASIFTQTYPSL